MLKDLIMKLVSQKALCTWKEAAAAVGVDGFKPSHIDAITKAFREAVPGSDALIVNQFGLYGRQELVERHTPFLVANGYDRVPGAMPTRVPKAKSATKDELAELKAQIALLTQALLKK